MQESSHAGNVGHCASVVLEIGRICDGQSGGDWKFCWLAQTKEVRLRGFAATAGQTSREVWLAQTKLARGSGKPRVSEVWRRRESKSKEHHFANQLMACDFW
jgi:hypothetical protein